MEAVCSSKMLVPRYKSTLLTARREDHHQQVSPPIEASSIDRTNQSRSPEDEAIAIPRNVVVYKQEDDG
jgi:hypothetical protein